MAWHHFWMNLISIFLREATLSRSWWRTRRSTWPTSSAWPRSGWPWPSSTFTLDQRYAGGPCYLRSWCPYSFLDHFGQDFDICGVQTRGLGLCKYFYINLAIVLIFAGSKFNFTSELTLITIFSPLSLYKFLKSITLPRARETCTLYLCFSLGLDNYYVNLLCYTTKLFYKWWGYRILVLIYTFPMLLKKFLEFFSSLSNIRSIVPNARVSSTILTKKVFFLKSVEIWKLRMGTSSCSFLPSTSHRGRCPWWLLKFLIT